MKFDSSLVSFRRLAIAPGALVPWRTKVWVVPVQNSVIEISVEGERWLGDRKSIYSLTKRFISGSFFTDVNPNIFGDSFKKSVKKFRGKVLEFFKCSDVVIPKNIWTIDGQHRWFSTRIYRTLSYKTSRKLFETVSEILSVRNVGHFNVWRTITNVISATFQKSSIVIRSPVICIITFGLCKDRTNAFAIHTGISPPAGMINKFMPILDAGGLSVSIFRPKTERDLPIRELRRHTGRSSSTHLPASARLRSHSPVFGDWSFWPRHQARSKPVRYLRRPVEVNVQLGLGSQFRSGARIGRHVSGGVL